MSMTSCSVCHFETVSPQRYASDINRNYRNESFFFKEKSISSKSGYTDYMEITHICYCCSELCTLSLTNTE